MQLNSVDVGKSFLINVFSVNMMGKMIINYGHLTTANTSAYVTHTVVETNVLMLVVWERFAGLGGIEKNALGSFLIGTDECAAATGSNHLVAVERHHAIVAYHIGKREL